MFPLKAITLPHLTIKQQNRGPNNIQCLQYILSSNSPGLAGVYGGLVKKRKECFECPDSGGN